MAIVNVILSVRYQEWWYLLNIETFFHQIEDILRQLWPLTPMTCYLTHSESLFRPFSVQTRWHRAVEPCNENLGIKFIYSCSLCKILHEWDRQAQVMHEASAECIKLMLSVSQVQLFAERAQVTKHDFFSNSKKCWKMWGNKRKYVKKISFREKALEDQESYVVRCITLKQQTLHVTFLLWRTILSCLRKCAVSVLQKH